MVLARTNDSAVEAISPRARIRLLYTDVSQTARRLARAHGYPQGPARLLGKVLAGTAAAGMDWTGPGDLLAVAADCEGGADGWYAEIDGVGHLRGCLNSTVFPDPPEPEEDARPDSANTQGSPGGASSAPGGSATSGASAGAPDATTRDPRRRNRRPGPPPDPELDALCGPRAIAKCTRFDSDGDITSQISVETKPGVPEAFFSRILGAALPTRLCLAATVYDGELDRVRALAMQTLPESVPGEIRRLHRLFDDGTILDTLCFDATLPTMRDVLGLDDIFTGPTQALTLGCRCSEEKVLASFATRPREVLRGMVRTGRPQIFRCHLCGRVWEIPNARLAEMLKMPQPKPPPKPGPRQTELPF